MKTLELTNWICGNIFETSGETAMICQVDRNKFKLICLDSGNRWDNKILTQGQDLFAKYSNIKFIANSLEEYLDKRNKN